MKRTHNRHPKKLRWTPRSDDLSVPSILFGDGCDFGKGHDEEGFSAQLWNATRRRGNRRRFELPDLDVVQDVDQNRLVLANAHRSFEGPESCAGGEMHARISLFASWERSRGRHAPKR